MSEHFICINCYGLSCEIVRFAEHGSYTQHEVTTVCDMCGGYRTFVNPDRELSNLAARMKQLEQQQEFLQHLKEACEDEPV